MKLFLKITLSVLIAIILIGAGGLFYITRGLETGSNIEIAGIDGSSLQDGTYKGKYTSGRWSNELNITVKGGKITNIEIVKDVAFTTEGLSANLFHRVLENQTTTVDVVTGATVTSKAYLKAIENALTSAQESKI
ncbi:MAG: hypothetical protein H6Q73_2241 [Firmicutes bacterium]|nr:hypothetical protein [Bacillota bacterium]